MNSFCTSTAGFAVALQLLCHASAAVYYADPGALNDGNLYVDIPPQVTNIRGVYIVGKRGDMETAFWGPRTNEWQPFLNAFGFVMAYRTQGEALCPEERDVPQKTLAALTDIAAQSGHPELAHAPVFIFGFSGDAAGPAAMAEVFPDRTLGGIWHSTADNCSYGDRGLADQRFLPHPHPGNQLRAGQLGLVPDPPVDHDVELHGPGDHRQRGLDPRAAGRRARHGDESQHTPVPLDPVRGQSAPAVRHPALHQPAHPRPPRHQSPVARGPGPARPFLGRLPGATSTAMAPAAPWAASPSGRPPIPNPRASPPARPCPRCRTRRSPACGRPTATRPTPRSHPPATRRRSTPDGRRAARGNQRRGKRAQTSFRHGARAKHHVPAQRCLHPLGQRRPPASTMRSSPTSRARSPRTNGPARSKSPRWMISPRRARNPSC